MRIIINGTVHELTKGNYVPYEHLVQAAGMTGHPSMTIKWPDGSGTILSPGRSAPLVEGVIISVCHTGNA